MERNHPVKSRLRWRLTAASARAACQAAPLLPDRYKAPIKRRGSWFSTARSLGTTLGARSQRRPLVAGFRRDSWPCWPQDGEGPRWSWIPPPWPGRGWDVLTLGPTASAGPCPGAVPRGHGPTCVSQECCDQVSRTGWLKPQQLISRARRPESEIRAWQGWGLLRA